MATNLECRLKPHPCPVPVMFRENTADVLRWVLHEPLQQVWADTPKNDRQIYPLIPPTDFFFQDFSKTSCLICITPSPVDCSHLILLSFCHVSLCRHQQGWGSKRTQAHAYTYTHMHKHFQQRPAEHCPHTLRGADTHGIPQERQNDSMVWADTLVYTLTPRVQPSARHTCTPAFTSPPSTAVWEQFPCTDYDA